MQSILIAHLWVTLLFCISLLHRVPGCTFWMLTSSFYKFCSFYFANHLIFKNYLTQYILRLLLHTNLTFGGETCVNEVVDHGLSLKMRKKVTVGNNMLLVADYFYTFILGIEFKTRHLWTAKMLGFISASHLYNIMYFRRVPGLTLTFTYIFKWNKTSETSNMVLSTHLTIIISF